MDSAGPRLCLYCNPFINPLLEKNSMRKIFRVILWIILPLFAQHSIAANVDFTGSYVGLVEVRTGLMGNWLIITLKDSAGNRVNRLCDAASPETRAAMALSFSDPTVQAVLSIALMAKATGKPVSGWSLDTPQGNWCGIGSLNVLP